jgi:hypothetical protein
MASSDAPATDTGCPVCGSANRHDVLSLPSIPVLVNAQVRPHDAASVPRGDMDLVVCAGCGHLYNRSFDPTLLDYDATYENTLHYSAHFRTFAAALRDRLVNEHQLVGERVAELGSGPGHFLSMLCDAGVSEALGFDPSYDADRLGAPEHRAVTISTDLFPSDGSLDVRLAFSQHVLEHLADPVAALVAQRRAVEAQHGVVYSEVPNGELMLQECALWDLIYEHRSYFVPTSLEVACRRAGLNPSIIGTAFGGQFLWCEATPGGATRVDADPGRVDSAVEQALAFGRAALQRIDEARRELASWAEIGPVALWGAGSKGMTYLNIVAADIPVGAVVDINPRKAGWGVPGTSFTISTPEELVSVEPRTVLVANPVYVGEIAAQLDALGVRADVRPLWGEQVMEATGC